jgi:hypothetical protein
MTIETVMTLFKRWAEGEDHLESDDFERMAGTKATDINQFADDAVGSM